MLQILSYIVFFLTAGASLALISINFGVSTGWIGGAFLISWGLFLRRRWMHLAQSTGAEPSPPERALWIQSAAYCILLGHLVTSLLHTNIDLHVGSGNTLAIDSWLMVLATMAAEFIFRKDRQVKDEPDAKYAATGTKSSYRALVILVLGLSFYITLTPPSVRESLTHFLLGNILIALILTAYTTQLIVRLSAYVNDRLHYELDKYS